MDSNNFGIIEIIEIGRLLIILVKSFTLLIDFTKQKNKPKNEPITIIMKLANEDPLFL